MYKLNKKIFTKLILQKILDRVALDQKTNKKKTSSLVNTTRSNKLNFFPTDGL